MPHTENGGLLAFFASACYLSEGIHRHDLAQDANIWHQFPAFQWAKLL
jgi:hypothetical protein